MGREAARNVERKPSASQRRLRAVDLFCGAGGSSWGAAKAGVEIVAGFDKWDLAGKVYKDNLPDSTFYCEDLASIDPETLTGELGEIDLLLASPECTNHSPAKGAGKRCEKSRETAFQVIRFAQALNPRWVVIENVVNMRRWGRFGEFLESLKAIGYNPKPVLLDSSKFGVPQSRRRLFILCDREREPSDNVRGSGSQRDARSIVCPNGMYPFSPLYKPGRARPTLERAERAIETMGPDADFIIVYYGSDQSGGWQSLDRPLRTITTLDRFAYVKPTATGHVMRMLQPEELKLAMGWPKSFRIGHGCRRDKIRMVGNAVCPKVMTAVIKSLCYAKGTH